MANTKHLPQLSENIINDLFSGFVVFLVAVPLCLGIALASGAPLLSGVITGIIGGIVVGTISKSHVSVSGPAAGLTVICVDAVHKLGSFEALLLATTVAGLFQIGFGILRLGPIAEYVPNSVIKGMLGGIGAVIIIKQIPHMLGRDTDHIGDQSFLQAIDGGNSLSSITSAIQNYHPTAALIGLVSVLLLIAWERPEIKKIKLFKIVPGSLIVVGVGILIDQFMLAFHPTFSLFNSPEHRVNLPIFDSFASAKSQILSPNFSMLSNVAIYKAALVIAIVASIESLLSVEASDKLDPYRRITPTNHELLAQGAGNTLAGLLGGLPLTAVIVRSSANVYAGAKTKLSSIYHGTLLLVACLFLPSILNLIPLAALAAVLIMVGYKLISPKTIKEMYLSGVDQYLPFAVTVAGIVFTDLLTGVGIGLCVGLFFVLRAGHHQAIAFSTEGNRSLILFNKDVSFVHKASLKQILSGISDGTELKIDRSKATFIDKDILDLLREFGEQATHRDITITTDNIVELGPLLTARA